MRAYSRLVFEDYVSGTTPVTTSDSFTDLLGGPCQLAIQAVASSISGTSPTLAVQIQTSHDGRVWSNKSATAEIAARGITTGGLAVEVGSDSGATPSLSKVRLQITLGGTSPAAFLKIWVCGRSSRKSRGALNVASDLTRGSQRLGVDASVPERSRPAPSTLSSARPLLAPSVSRSRVG